MVTTVQLTLFPVTPQPLPPAPDWIEALICSHRMCDDVATATIVILGRFTDVCERHAAKLRTP